MRLGYTLDAGVTARATLGLIVLKVDETLEREFRLLIPADVALHITRILSGDDLTPDTIAAMEIALPAAAGLLPQAAAFDVIGYACTSGTTLIGADRVAERVREGVACRAVTNPLDAVTTALGALGAQRVAMVTPYIDLVAGPVRAALEEAGFATSTCLSFGEAVEARVARIDARSVRAAAVQAARAAPCDAVFLSCTNLRSLPLIDGLEAELGMPVLSSNLALAWHMAQLAGLSLPGAPGRLMRIGRVQ